MGRHRIEIEFNADEPEQAEHYLSLVQFDALIHHVHAHVGVPTFGMTPVITQAPDPVERIWQDDL